MEILLGAWIFVHLHPVCAQHKSLILNTGRPFSDVHSVLSGGPDTECRCRREGHVRWKEKVLKTPYFDVLEWLPQQSFPLYLKWFSIIMLRCPFHGK